MNLPSPSATAVILAAGQGKRMNSALHKVLHRVCGRTMIHHVLEAVEEAGIERSVVIVGPDADQIRESVAADFAGNVDYAVQAEPQGTAHAVRQAEPLLQGVTGDVLLCCGDTPLLRASTLASLVERRRASGVAALVLTAEVDDPWGYGRIMRDPMGDVVQIVEQRDCKTMAVASIREVNTGVYCVAAEHLFAALAAVRSDNSQGEYYLPDIIPVLAEQGLKVAGIRAEDAGEMVGVNSRRQLAQATTLLCRRVIEELMDDGVTIVDPATTYIEPRVRIGPDSFVAPQTIFEGVCDIGTGCRIGPGAIVRNCRVGDRTVIENAVVEDSEIEADVRIGPFAHIRDGARLRAGASIPSHCLISGREVAPDDAVEEGARLVG